MNYGTGVSTRRVSMLTMMAVAVVAVVVGMVVVVKDGAGGSGVELRAIVGLQYTYLIRPSSKRLETIYLRVKSLTREIKYG